MAQLTILTCDLHDDNTPAIVTISLKIGKKLATFDACEEHAQTFVELMDHVRGQRPVVTRGNGTKGAKLHGGKYLSTQEAAALLGVSSAMIQKAYRNGRLELAKKEGRTNFYRVAAIEALRR